VESARRRDIRVSVIERASSQREIINVFLSRGVSLNCRRTSELKSEFKHRKYPFDRAEYVDEYSAVARLRLDDEFSLVRSMRSAFIM